MADWSSDDVVEKWAPDALTENECEPQTDPSSLQLPGLRAELMDVAPHFSETTAVNKSSQFLQKESHHL